MSLKDKITNALRGWVTKAKERQQMDKSVEERWQAPDEDDDWGDYRARFQARARQLQEDMQERIADRAYQKFVERGYEHGHHEQDWLDAEAELQFEATRQTFNNTLTESDEIPPIQECWGLRPDFWPANSHPVRPYDTADDEDESVTFPKPVL